MTDLIDDEQNDHCDQQQWNTFQRILGRPWWGYAVTLLGTYFLIKGVPSILIVLGGGTTGNSSSGMSTAYVFAGLIFLVMIVSIGCAVFRDLSRKTGGLFPEPEQNPWHRRGWIMSGIGFRLFTLASFIELSRPSSANVDMQDWGTCVISPHIKCKFSSFYTAFEKWCDESGFDCPSKKKTGTKLKERFDVVPD